MSQRIVVPDHEILYLNVSGRKFLGILYKWDLLYVFTFGSYSTCNMTPTSYTKSKKKILVRFYFADIESSGNFFLYNYQKTPWHQD